MIADVPVGVLLKWGSRFHRSPQLRGRADRQRGQHLYRRVRRPGCSDERPFAKLAADTFGTKHHEMTIDAASFADFMPKYVWHMEEPVCEPPAIAMYYVSKMARKYVKVLLSGEGGDEAFAGYSNYRNLLWMERVKRISRR